MVTINIKTFDMDQDFLSLSKKVISILEESSNDRILVTITGIPGSGKSTIANAIANSINTINYEKVPRLKPRCISISMDGYHLSRSDLNAMDDPEYAFKRRGAPFTFDADGVVNLVRALRNSCNLPKIKRPIIKVPSFDHKEKDPLTNGITIDSDINIIILEGNYLLLNIEPWNEIEKYADERWFVDVDIEIARERLAKRHVEAGIEKSINDALTRVDSNDTLNGIFILENCISHIDYTIKG